MIHTSRVSLKHYKVMMMVSFNIRNNSVVWANEWHHSDTGAGLVLTTVSDVTLASDWTRLIT